jgi:transcriptional regulator with XRE-family HTH domain
MIPFGTCLQLWRKKQGMSKADLAQKAGVPQPNLSDMERGEREVSLRTLRALAFALEIPAGVLADGVGPEAEKPLVLTRERLERVAGAVAEGKSLTDPSEEKLAGEMAWLMKARLRAAGHRGKRPSFGGSSRVPDPWVSISGAYRPEEIQSLVERISEKAARSQAGPPGEHP